MTLLNKEPVKRAEKCLKEFDENLSVVELENSAKTALDAANSLNCEVGAIVKSLLIKIENDFLLCLVSGDKRCSLNKLKKLTNKKCFFIDAPVSGGEIGAINGNLSIMVGGEKRIFNRIKPLLSILGSNITYVGKSGSGQIAKACNQILVAQTIIAVSEILFLAKETNTDPVLVQKVSFQSEILFSALDDSVKFSMSGSITGNSESSTGNISPSYL